MTLTSVAVNPAEPAGSTDGMNAHSSSEKREKLTEPVIIECNDVMHTVRKSCINHDFIVRKSGLGLGLDERIMGS